MTRAVIRNVIAWNEAVSFELKAKHLDAVAEELEIEVVRSRKLAVAARLSAKMLRRLAEDDK